MFFLENWCMSKVGLSALKFRQISLLRKVVFWLFESPLSSKIFFHWYDTQKSGQKLFSVQSGQRYVAIFYIVKWHVLQMVPLQSNEYMSCIWLFKNRVKSYFGWSWCLGGSQSTPKGYRVHVVCQVSLLIHLTLLKHCNKFIFMAFRRIRTIQ